MKSLISLKRLNNLLKAFLSYKTRGKILAQKHPGVDEPELKTWWGDNMYKDHGQPQMLIDSEHNLEKKLWIVYT